jgi:hypothetical protein
MFRILILAILLSGAVCVVAQDTQRDKGILLFQEGKYSEAAAVLRHSTETEDQSSTTWIYLVFSYLKLGDQRAADEAFASFRKIQFKPPYVYPKTYDRAIRLSDEPKAKYTEEARQAGVEGEVHLWVECQADGKIGAIYPETPLPHGLTERAIKASRKIRFEPAVRNGKPVPLVLAFAYYFKLG